MQSQGSFARGAVPLVAALLLASCEGAIITSGDGGPDVSCSGATCAPGTTCQGGICVPDDLCEGIYCPIGSICDRGACIRQDACEGVVCSTPGEVCQHGVCVSGAADSDGDGYPASVDCDDEDPTVHPGAPEVCNGVRDGCDDSIADGTADCPGLCCGASPACRECCFAAQCGPGAWSCSEFACTCPGRQCGDSCMTGSGCCTASDCGSGPWACTGGSCVCTGVACGGECRAAGSCCTATDCGAGAWACSAGSCVCAGVSCAGSCLAPGSCCTAADCGTGSWSCTRGSCACTGRLCGSECRPAGSCCTASECGAGSWTCTAAGACHCACYECGGTCYGSSPCCSFTDVPTTYYAHDEIVALCAAGIVEGSGGAYRPEDSMTRAQMAVVLVRAMGESPSTLADDFYFDDMRGHWAAGHVNRLAALGITSGCEVREYCPDIPITRRQAAVLLVRALGESGSTAGTTAYFDDLEPGDSANASINRLQELGIAIGCAVRRFCPTDPLLRAAGAAMLARAYLCF